jgi:cell division protein FtsA
MDKSSTQEKSSPIVVGLDIGTTKICAIVGRRSKNGKIEVLGIGKAESAGVTRGMVSNIDKTVQGITQAVDVAGTQSNVEVRIVNVGIAGQHIKSLQHRGLITRKDLNTEIGRKDIDKLVEDMYNLVMPPGEEIIHVLPQEFTVDNEPGVKDPIGMAGVRLEANFHIISGQVTAIKNIVKCVNKAGLESQELILEPLAGERSRCGIGRYRWWHN